MTEILPIRLKTLSNQSINQSAMQDLDETGMTLAYKPSKVLTKKGAKAIYGYTSSSRELKTVIASGNAAGDYLPPHFVFPGKLYCYYIASTMERSSSIKGANFFCLRLGSPKRSS